jgi:hypothetical protein
MAGLSILDPIRRALRENARKKRVRLAAQWPQAQAHVNTWKILPLGDEAESFSRSDFIEAAFHFNLNGEYYGGYLRSVGMAHREAEKLATGSPAVTVRYNPANPDQTVVLAEDNASPICHRLRMTPRHRLITRPLKESRESLTPPNRRPTGTDLRSTSDSAIMHQSRSIAHVKRIYLVLSCNWHGKPTSRPNGLSPPWNPRSPVDNMAWLRSPVLASVYARDSSINLSGLYRRMESA